MFLKKKCAVLIIAGAYFASMQGIPSHLTQKDNNDLNKYVQKFKTKSNYVARVSGINFKSKQQQTVSFNLLISVLACFQPIAKLQKIMATRMQFLNCIQRLKGLLYLDKTTSTSKIK